MPWVARLGDWCSGHECFPPRQNNEGSPNVFVNARGWHRKGDNWQVHSCGDDSHDGKLKAGSSTVFVNNVPAGRFGDPIVCRDNDSGSSSAVITGSPNVICGG